MLSPQERQLVERAARICSAADNLKVAEKKAVKVRNEASDLLQHAETLAEQIQQVCDEKTKCFPWLSDAIAQFFWFCDLRIEQYLRSKAHPAKKAADTVRSLSIAKREAERKYRIARNRVRYYESLFPFLPEYVGEDLDEIVNQCVHESADTERNSRDPVSSYMPQAEYERLSTAERNDLALSRYFQRRKSDWEIGLDYERYIGYLFETEGYAVDYLGASEGLNDLGRDLLAKRFGEALIIQCKRWSAHKLIREKHIMQLYGTAVEYWLRHGGKADSTQPTLFPSASATVGTVRAVFVTSTKLSRTAQAFAEQLGVEVREDVAMDLGYPSVKCNISRQTNERIYHLPMDQQYDKIVIEPERGECYVKSAAEAERIGFRRAFRWRGKTNP